jgi:hypothetical protein
MNRIKMTGMLAIATLVAGAVPMTPAAAGPGGVYYAAKKLLDALDRGDAEYLKTAFSHSRHGLEFSCDAAGKLHETQSKHPLAFWDVAADGSAWHAQSAQAVITTTAKLDDAELGRPTSVLTSVYADCPAGECSYAVVEFDRTFGEGKGQRTVPMRATALMRYAGAEKGPNFRIFHWHAARR